jgi:outer membrane protein OmpA-like peptidoglycan-associated protein
MSRSKILVFLSLTILSGVPQLLGQSQRTLQVLRFAEDRTTKFSMMPTSRVPGAEMKGSLKFEEGQARIELEYEGMKSAVLFGGDVTCYVLWAINRDGASQNLGEFWVEPGSDSEKLLFTTGLRSFALMVTAEPYYLVEKPSDLVIFVNAGSANPPIPADPLDFNSFAAAPRIGVENLGNVRYDGKKPLDLIQAERVFEMAKGMSADTYASDLFKQASIALEQATHIFNASRAKGSQRFARRSVSASNDAISVTKRKVELAQLEAQIAERQARTQDLQARAEREEQRAKEAEQLAEQTRTNLEAATAELEKTREEQTRVQASNRELEQSVAKLRQERADLSKSMQQLEVEKTDLQGRLQGALSQVADTRDSARGMIVNLPDILFDIGQATLKEEAKLPLVKLAGILLIMQDLNLRIEGHTDSTGSPSMNQRLSEKRADSVYDLLVSQGISSSRIRTAGYGMERPIAENTTADGRSKNRRVEIVIAEGNVAEEVR